MIPDAIIIFIVSILLTLVFDEQVPLLLVFALDLVEISFLIEAGNFVPDIAFEIFLLTIAMLYDVLKMIRRNQELSEEKNSLNNKRAT